MFLRPRAATRQAPAAEEWDRDDGRARDEDGPAPTIWRGIGKEAEESEV